MTSSLCAEGITTSCTGLEKAGYIDSLDPEAVADLADADRAAANAESRPEQLPTPEQLQRRRQRLIKRIRAATLSQDDLDRLDAEMIAIQEARHEALL